MKSHLVPFAIIGLGLVAGSNGLTERSEQPYKFERPFEGFLSKRVGSLLEIEDLEDQIAIDTSIVEKDENPSMDNNRRIAISKPETAMPTFPNFPQFNKTDGKKLVKVNGTEVLPEAQPLRMRDRDRSRLNNHRLSPSRYSSKAKSKSKSKSRPKPKRTKIPKLPFNITPQAESFRSRRPPKKEQPPPPPPAVYDYYDYYDYDYGDYYEEMTYKNNKPLSKPYLQKGPPYDRKPSPPSAKLSFKNSGVKSFDLKPPNAPPRSPSLAKFAGNNDRIPSNSPPPKMTSLKKKTSASHASKYLKNHRMPPFPPVSSSRVKKDRFSSPYKPGPPPASVIPPVSAPSSSSSGGAKSELKASPARPQRFEYDYYEYYDDDEYYDDFYVQETKRPKRRQGYGGGGSGINPLALLVAPLAAISLLAAAAAVAINPVLVTVSFTGRKKRSLESVDESEWNPELKEKMHEMQVLEKFLGTIPDNVGYQHQILSMYLSCSGYTEPSNQCLDRVVCDYSHPESPIDQEEKDVISIILYNIMANSYVGEDYKSRLRKAAKTGRDSGQSMEVCKKTYHCSDLDDH